MSAARYEKGHEHQTTKPGSCEQSQPPAPRRRRFGADEPGAARRRLGPGQWELGRCAKSPHGTAAAPGDAAADAAPPGQSRRPAPDPARAIVGAEGWAGDVGANNALESERR